MNHTALLNLMKGKQYSVFENDRYPYNLNIIGVRYPGSRVNYFDDHLFVIWKQHGKKWSVNQWSITTYPGKPSLLKPSNPRGTAILVPGQYLNCYELGLHKGKYEALIQVRPVKVFRDNDFDDAFDMGNIATEQGLFGINIHKAGILSKLVGPNSEGCQVFQKASEFDQFIDLCKKARNNWGTYFSYTLIEV